MIPEQEDTGVLDIRITSGNPTEEEIAAVSAVLAVVVAEERAHAEIPEGTAPSAWARSQRAIRTNITPGRGHWRGFNA
ncbi:acyl-CoA carboxylase epsilon subunit [Mycetocola spongiae]|uniref:acyl-CoA carboxylase epsilon subunit n=1 Tax=Mycetocola spongiae TaxID=2859226 RepID=UPI001CF3E22A|nr:acyl-CoA carboxylase epsilon subunit [Mycetocola spongiae]UCR90357.1 acyl-CoA carboxylase subunit epsilon [Mycetocola spongiae]